MSRFSHLHADGSKARTRFHHGLVAQEVAEVIARTGLDFGGYQDHTVNGGEDVRSLGYSELIAPLIKAVQELAARNDDLERRLRTIEGTRGADALERNGPRHLAKAMGYARAGRNQPI